MRSGESSWNLDWRAANGEMPATTASCPRVLQLYPVRVCLSPRICKLETFNSYFT